MNTIKHPTPQTFNPTQVLEYAHVYQDQDLTEAKFLEKLKQQSDLVWKIIEQNNPKPVLLVDNCPYHSIAHPNFSIEGLLHALQKCSLPAPATIYFEDNYTQAATLTISQLSPIDIHKKKGILKLTNKKGPIIQGSDGNPSCALLETTWLNQELANTSHTVVLSHNFQKQQSQKQQIISTLQQLGFISQIESQAIYY